MDEAVTEYSALKAVSVDIRQPEEISPPAEETGSRQRRVCGWKMTSLFPRGQVGAPLYPDRAEPADKKLVDTEGASEGRGGIKLPDEDTGLRLKRPQLSPRVQKKRSG